MFTKNKKIGLVLGSGAAKGLAHIGILKILDELDMKPSFITGTSIGALIGGLYASGYTGKEIEKIANGIDKKHARALFKITLNKDGFVDGTSISKFLNSLFCKKNIQEFKIPFACVACNIVNDREFIFESGNAVDAIRASISIPVLLSPHRINKNILVDGGLINPVPIDLARRMGADFIIAINVLKPPHIKHKKMAFPEHVYKKNETTKRLISNNPKTVNNKIKEFIGTEIVSLEQKTKKLLSFLDINNQVNIVDIITQTFFLGEANLAQIKVKADRPDILITPDTSDIKHLEFFKSREAIIIGEKAIWEKIAKIKINEDK